MELFHTFGLSFFAEPGWVCDWSACSRAFDQ